MATHLASRRQRAPRGIEVRAGRGRSGSPRAATGALRPDHPDPPGSPPRPEPAAAHGPRPGPTGPSSQRKPPGWRPSASPPQVPPCHLSSGEPRDGQRVNDVKTAHQVKSTPGRRWVVASGCGGRDEVSNSASDIQRSRRHSRFGMCLTCPARRRRVPTPGSARRARKSRQLQTGGGRRVATIRSRTTWVSASSGGPLSSTTTTPDRTVRWPVSISSARRAAERPTLWADGFRYGVPVRWLRVRRKKSSASGAGPGRSTMRIKWSGGAEGTTAAAWSCLTAHALGSHGELDDGGGAYAAGRARIGAALGVVHLRERLDSDSRTRAMMRAPCIIGATLSRIVW